MVRNEKRVTLLDVAKEAGVSRATASLVVRGSKTISLPTQKKVEEAMSRLGYIYDRAAANLRSHRSNTVGMIINDIGNPYFADLLKGLSKSWKSINIMSLLDLLLTLVADKITCLI